MCLYIGCILWVWCSVCMVVLLVLVSLVRWVLEKLVCLSVCRWVVFSVLMLLVVSWILVWMIFLIWFRNYGLMCDSVKMFLMLKLVWNVLLMKNRCFGFGVFSLCLSVVMLFLLVRFRLVGFRLILLVFRLCSVFCRDFWKVWFIVIILFIDFIWVVRWVLVVGNFLNVKCGILVMM